MQPRPQQGQFPYPHPSWFFPDGQDSQIEGQSSGKRLKVWCYGPEGFVAYVPYNHPLEGMVSPFEPSQTAVNAHYNSNGTNNILFQGQRMPGHSSVALSQNNSNGGHGRIPPRPPDNYIPAPVVPLPTNFTGNGNASNSSYSYSSSGGDEGSSYTDEEGSGSSDGESDDVHHQNKTLLRNSQRFFAAVGAVAESGSQGGTGAVDLSKINWQAVANQFPGQTASSCLEHWKSHFGRFNLVRHPEGIVWCENVGNGPGNQIQNQAPMNIYTSAAKSLTNGRSGLSKMLRKSPSAAQRTVLFHDGEDGDGNSPESSGNLAGQMQKITSEPAIRTLTGRKPRTKKREWTEQELKLIEDMRAQIGNKWTIIAKRLGNERTALEVKNYWHSKQQRMALKILKDHADS